MNRWLAITSAVVMTCTWNTGYGQDLMPPHVIQQLGLTQVWARPVSVPIGAQSIADQQLYVHQEEPHEYVEIVTVPPKSGASDAASASGDDESPQPQGKVLVRIPTDRIGANGTAIGRKEAERLASNEIRRLKRRGVEAEINVRTVPRVVLYTIGTDGTLECRDAETGEPQWMVRVGDRRLPYLDLGVDEDYLTVINGANLIQVEAATGEVMAEVRTRSGVPVFGAIHAGDFAMIPLAGGGVGCYPLRDPTRYPFLEIVAGAALAMPKKAPGSSRTAWGTDQGYVYVMEMQGSPSVQFRLNTDGIVSGRLASATGDRFFFGSESGQVYGLRATRSGKVLWSKPVGEPFYNEPMVVGGQLLIRSTYGNLYSMAVESGLMTWERPTPNMGELIASFDGRLYATGLSGALAVIDVETGARIGIFNEVRPQRLLVNTLTDRLYLVSEGGDVQCLKLADSDLPKFNVQPDVESAEEESTAEPEKEPETTPFGPGNTDPFGDGAADPFGGGDDGAMDDPFGGGDDAAGDDPFGGNPFGN